MYLFGLGMLTAQHHMSSGETLRNSHGSTEVFTLTAQDGRRCAAWPWAGYCGAAGAWHQRLCRPKREPRERI